MMKSGFLLRELRLSGKSVKDASIEFKRGVNIITGPSNTGKTYIFQCLNYMFGGSKPPKGIKEARAYDSIYLEIEDAKGAIYTLISDLKGGNFKLFSAAIDSIKETDLPSILERKHSPTNENTISGFMLRLNNLLGKKIRTNEKGKTRNISYRDVVKLSMINENQIITEDSPIVSHYTKATEESNVLKLIATGRDDSSIIASLSPNQIANRKGKLEMLNEFINYNEKELKTFKIDPFIIYEESSSAIEKLNLRHLNLQYQYNEIENKRKDSVDLLLEKKSRKRIIEELYKRSDLLKSHYISDIARLKSTIEASVLLNDENHAINGNCPLCNGELKEECSSANIHVIIKSCEAEIDKIEFLKEELTESEKILKEEFDQISLQALSLDKEIDRYTTELNKGVGFEMGEIIEEVNQQNEKKNSALGALATIEQLKKFKNEKAKLEESLPASKSKQVFENLSTSLLTNLSKGVYSVLEGYNYPNLTSVSFSEEQKDFVISGEDRNLSGKGYRAIIYSAFIIALHELLINTESSIGVPIIDSPLVTYRKPDNEGEITITDDLAMDFYRYIANVSELRQIIIIENEEPPADIKNKIHHVIFKRDRGFIPATN